MAEDPGIGADDVIIPIVAECDDSFLSDARRMQVGAQDVRAALAAARASAGGPAPEQGAVGAGTGMTCLGYKGGIGSASRLVESAGRRFAVGVLLLSNFGDRGRLTVDGVPAGRLLAPPGDAAVAPPAGSCIVVAVTDAPLDSAGCARLARRAGLGLARTGSTARHGSGEIFLGLATGLRAPRGRAAPGPPLTGRELDPLFAAVVEATEEAVLNSLLAAITVTGRDGHTSYALPRAELAGLLRAAGRAGIPRRGADS
jgi:D-aminopeptidase